ncbi:hypothetical protein hmeg3_17770 [Herbaspirillum sp. meg3]|uniref:TonB-dependent hemoglobin/transferrin/lactoferrin family receptor n=1 Tax=Herbaspirillum sp. meg3 TaxID=2025949 RepID=UPI000B99B971|nr:TonB-dependent hemoglobin/transferrin/lactoferrin family receptor [Herbaspirillum sp. meg3]ASU39953.1 hypothetical protein hmeg3_17770 [Herbaspirillum sp. meg3]
MLKMNRLTLAVMLTCARGFALAGENDPNTDAAHLRPDQRSMDEIVVRAVRTDAIAASVSVTTREDILERGARNIKDVLADQPDVMVRTRPSDFSAARSATGRARNEGINIRGIEGNRVLIVQDGIRLPNGFSFGPAFQTGRGDYWDVDSFKRIEVLRGANSTQYGADSLAGVVSATTLGPSDLVKAGKAVGGFAQSAYAQQDNSVNHMAGVAFNDERWQGMFMGSLRSGHETWSQENDRRANSNRTAPNPVDMESRYYLTKLGFRADAGNRLQATLENLNLQVNTNVLTQVSPVPSFRSTAAMRGYDTTKRQRLSFEYFHEGSETDWLNRLHAHAYWQDSSVRQITTERVFGPRSAMERMFFNMFGAFYGAIAPGVLRRSRDNSYDERIAGLNVVADTNLRMGGGGHALRYGIDLSHSDIATSVGGTVPFSGHQYPYKPSPDTSYLLAGGFLQDEISISTLKIIPGLRYDFFRIAPDASSLSSYDKAQLLLTHSTPKSQSAHAFTPRLGVIWEIAPAFVPYFNYAKGFRAPTPDQINANFFNPSLFYLASGNPDLRPERVTGKELGVRGAIQGFHYSVAAFDSRYSDFIRQRLVGVDMNLPAFVYKNVNENKARIRGVELKSEWDMSAAWRVNAAIAYARGDVMTSVFGEDFAADGSVSVVGTKWQPLDSVQPMRAVVGARYRQASWGAHVNLEHSWGKSSDRISRPSRDSVVLMTSPSTVVSAGTWIQPLEGFTVTFNVENVFNAYYERWSDVGELPPSTGSNSTRRHYTAPPRSLQLALRYSF